MKYPLWSYTTQVSLDSSSYGTTFLPEPYSNLFPSKNDFYYGNCAIESICAIFDIPYRAIKVLCIALTITDCEEGLTFNQCKRLISLLAKTTPHRPIYSKNSGKSTYYQLSLLLKGKYLILFDEHLSYMEDGNIYDSFLYEKCADYKKIIPTGWWQIKI